ncbi:hypothetical protein OAT18_04025, partial [Tenacibaculum sp.]|nr:hypothetical protein [Tenacibaculum sp.]
VLLLYLMERSYEQLNTDFIETRKVSLLTKLGSISLSIAFFFIPLVDIVPGFEYLYNMFYYCTYRLSCIVGGTLNCFPFF